jgi:hypothetical protein
MITIKHKPGPMPITYIKELPISFKKGYLEEV